VTQRKTEYCPHCGNNVPLCDVCGNRLPHGYTAGTWLPHKGCKPPRTKIKRALFWS
jgi:hypothetical protein